MDSFETMDRKLQAWAMAFKKKPFHSISMFNEYKVIHFLDDSVDSEWWFDKSGVFMFKKRREEK